MHHDVVFLRRATELRHIIDAEGQETFRREAAGHVFDVRIETTVFVRHDNGREFTAAGRHRQIPLNIARCTLESNALDLDARIVLGNRRIGVIAGQHRRNNGRGGRPTSQLGQPAHEHPSLHRRMGEFVKKIVNFLADDHLVHSILHSVN